MIQLPTLELTESQQRALETMPQRVAEALSHFCDALLARFPDQILYLILYGSFARGEAHAESDVDVMVVVAWEEERLPGGWFRSPVSDPRWREIIDLAVQATLECDRYVSALVLGRTLFYDPSTHAARAARREGLKLYDRRSGVTPVGKWLAAPRVAEEMATRPSPPGILKEGIAGEYDAGPADLDDPRLWIALADEKLHVSRDLFDAAHYHDAVSRAYYGMFYAAKAALLSIGVVVKTHAGVNSELGRHFVKTGRIDARYQAMLSHAEEARLRSDYAPKTRPEKDDVEWLIGEAKEFIAKARELVDDELYRRSDLPS
jgi:uncharacterized protein (UPF0332 family)/predicted nucleotidyltransferase